MPLGKQQRLHNTVSPASTNIFCSSEQENWCKAAELSPWLGLMSLSQQLPHSGNVCNSVLGAQHVPADPTDNAAFPIAGSGVGLLIAVAVTVAVQVDSEGICEAQWPDGEGLAFDALLGCDLHFEGDLESAE